jgi:hypothetical protein
MLKGRYLTLDAGVESSRQAARYIFEERQIFTDLFRQIEHKPLIQLEHLEREGRYAGRVNLADSVQRQGPVGNQN